MEVMQSPEAQSPGLDPSDGRAASSARKTRSRRWRLGRGASPVWEREVRADCACRNAYGELGGEAEEVVLDVRDLGMEGQIGRTLERMEVLSEGRRLRHINTLIPWPLLAMLDSRGCRYRLVGRSHGAIHILIWRQAGSPNPAAKVSLPD